MVYFIHNTFAIHYKATKFFLDNAIASEEGQFYNLISSISFCAFTMEAYLNHQGYIEIGEKWNDWDARKKPNIKTKFSKLAKIYNLDIDFTSEPYSTIIPLFQFRDLIVHGRTEVVKKKVKKPQNNTKGALLNLSSNIEKLCTIKKAKKICKHTKEIIENFNENSSHKVGKSRLWSIGNGSYKIKHT